MSVITTDSKVLTDTEVEDVPKPSMIELLDSCFVDKNAVAFETFIPKANARALLYFISLHFSSPEAQARFRASGRSSMHKALGRIWRNDDVHPKTSSFELPDALDLLIALAPAIWSALAFELLLDASGSLKATDSPYPHDNLYCALYERRYLLSINA